VTRPGRPGTTAAVLFGGAAAFVVAEQLVERIRPALLLDPDPGWALVRLVLWLGLLSATAAAGALAAALFLLWTRSRLAPSQLAALPFRSASLVFIAVGAVTAGALLRITALDRIPPSLWIDDVSLIEPALALQGELADFADSVRAAPYGVPRPYGSVGVFYLELYRLALHLFGTTVFGVRFLSAAAGILSLITAMLLARALLPRGGGALAALVLAGLRWHLLLSRWAWNAIVLAPFADIAVLLLLKARRTRSLPAAVAAGLVAGLATHIYLAAWVAAVALVVLAAWPAEPDALPVRPRLRLLLAFVVAFGLASSPLFLLKANRTSPYFARAADHSVLREIGYMHTPLPAFAAVADSLTAPWFGVDPFAHHDLPGKTRLGWMLGIPVAVAFGRSLLRPRDALSALLLAECAAALAASVAGGHAGLPNSYRFGYLTTVTAVAAAGGLLCILGWVPAARRRVAALAAIGLVAISGALASRDALLRWPVLHETFDGFHGQDTLLARAMVRWERYGEVRLAPDLVHSHITVEGIRRYRLDPDLPPAPPARAAGRGFRIVLPGVPRRPGERLVERIGDAWGREWGWVYGARR
jgi:Dolichyl-phosphate-mannose-protein mannosyltransferase